MTTAIKLSDTQKLILKRAAKTADGKLTWFPDTLKGGARTKVIDALLNRALITADGTDWTMAAEGYDALGIQRPVPDDNEAAQVEPATAKPRTRENSKQAQVIAMLKRPEGATIQQIAEATQWQAHTIRGTISGSLKKKLGLEITSTKEAGGQRVYRVS
ncbi:MAG: DUF3489 domain-containing protein [Proteobacteria bacterium]|nr:DUF3489 domain-containing protein [Pseudomonadota bacterium]